VLETTKLTELSLPAHFDCLNLTVYLYFLFESVVEERILDLTQAVQEFVDAVRINYFIPSCA
jgi:hypothetical protein